MQNITEMTEAEESSTDEDDFYTGGATDVRHEEMHVIMNAQNQSCNGTKVRDNGKCKTLQCSHNLM